MTFVDQTVGDILENYADVIEGGNSYRGSGSAYVGIPGTDSVADELPLEITASDNGTTTTVIDDTQAWVDSDRWSRPDMAPYFLACSSATNAQNVGVARKISAWDLSSTTFTTAAFPAATTASDVFDILEGFRRIRDGIDIEGEEDKNIPEGFDRNFQLDFEPGEPDTVFGRKVERFRGQLVLRVRFLKRHRIHTARQRAFSNIARLRTIITKPEHLGTYVRAVYNEGSPEILINDSKKIVVEERFAMIYAINTEFE